MTEAEKFVDNLGKNSTSPEPKKKSGKGIYYIAIIVLICVVLFAGNDPFFAPSDIFGKPTVSLNLEDFEVLTDGNITNVEFILTNTGEKTAEAITVFVRAKDQNGTILLSDNVNTTTLILSKGQKTTGFYMFSSTNVTSIKHTIEVSWTGGRKLFTELTNF